MKIIEENIIEIFALLGIISISIGLFMYSVMVGFVGTGILLLGLALMATPSDTEIWRTRTGGE